MAGQAQRQDLYALFQQMFPQLRDITPVQQQQAADPRLAVGSDAGVGGYNPYANAPQYSSEALRSVFGDTAGVTARQVGVGDDARYDPSLGYTVKAGGANGIYADYDAQGNLIGTRRNEGDSALMNLMRVAMPALAMYAGGAAAAGAGAASGGAAPAAVQAPAGGMSAMPGATNPLGLASSAPATSMNTGAASFMPGMAPSQALPGLTFAPSMNTGLVSQMPVQAPISASAPTTVLGPDAGTQAAVAPATAPAVAPQSGAAAAAAAKPLLSMENLQTAAQFAGPAMSLLSGVQQVGSLPQQPADAPRLPGLEAPPEARGYQAGVAPILDVLGRNQRDGRNRTLLTGPRGVNMDSVRARGNTLLGL